MKENEYRKLVDMIESTTTLDEIDHVIKQIKALPDDRYKRQLAEMALMWRSGIQRAMRGGSGSPNAPSSGGQDGGDVS